MSTHPPPSFNPFLFLLSLFSLLFLLHLPLSHGHRPSPPPPLFTPSAEVDVDICANTSYSRSYYSSSTLHCTLFNVSLSFNSSRYLIPKTSSMPAVTLLNCVVEVLNVTSPDPSYPLNYLFLTMYQTLSVSLINTTLRAPHIWLFSGSNVSIDRLSRISADGFAPSGLPTYPLPTNFTSGQQGGGGGSGGVGGRGCIRDYPTAKGGGARGDPVSPPEGDPQYGGPGSIGYTNRTRSVSPGADAEDGFGLGGGFVLIEVSAGELLVEGQITANGVAAWHPTLAAGGGGGGFISLVLSSALPSRVATSAGSLIAANGGMGVNGGGGGAGGRIYISAGTAQVYDMQAYGGGVGTEAQECATEGGGQGTIYLRSSNTTGDVSLTVIELRCIGPSSTPIDQSSHLPFIGSTDFSNSSTVDNLVLTYCYLLTTPLVQLTASLAIYNSVLQPSPTVDGSAGSLTIQCPILTTASNPPRMSAIKARSLTVIANDITLGSGDEIQFDGQCVLNATDRLDVQGRIEWGQLQTPSPLLQPTQQSRGLPGLLVLAAPVVTLESASSVSAEVVELVAEQLTVAGVLSADYQRKDANCSAAIPYISLTSTCTALPFSFTHPSTWSPWASVVISARSSFISTPLIEGAIVVVCSDTIHLEQGATISTNANGCPESGGEGAGSLTGSGEGGGAGHGGVGGEGIPERGVVEEVLAGGAGGTYDNGSFPCMLGSGGKGGSAGGTGGSGGGLIYMEARLLSMSAGSKLSSDGGAGTGPASGGGSGGSIVLHLGSIHADASLASFVSASGGAATGDVGAGKSGGSGGGGRVFVAWSAAQPLNQRAAIVFSVHPGNASSNFSIGEHGTVVAEPPCGAGFQGILCESCPVGRFKNETGPAQCSACEGGAYTNLTNSTRCALCPAGTFSNVNFTGCLDCPDNSFSGEGSAECSACAAGYESDDRHTGCEMCPMGKYKGETDTECVLCQDGDYSDAPPVRCLQCPPPPAHSHYVSLVGFKCQFDCDVGYLPPNCLTPFWSMVDSIGGVAVFVGFLVVTLTVTFIPFLLCFIRSKRRQREREILEQDEAETDSEAGDSRPPSPPAPGKLGRNFSAQPQSYDTALNTSLMEQGTRLSFKDLPSTSLQPRHYPHHLYRLYFQGDNSPHCPFALSAAVPSEVAPLVFEELYADFAAQVSTLGRWKRSEDWLYAALCWLCLPLSSSYLRAKRRRKVEAVWRSIIEYDHRMLRNAKSRALASSLLFGVSPCHTLAWIDVLANSRDEKLEKGGEGATGLPRLPLVLMASGDGSYHTPFHFDVSDAYVKSATEYVGMNWYKFVRMLNSHVRTVRRSSLFSPTALAPALALLAMESHMGIGIGKHLPLGGVRVELGWVGEDSGIGGGALPALILTAKEDGGQSMLINTALGKKATDRPSHPASSLSRGVAVAASRVPVYRRDDRSPQSSDSGRDAQRLSQSYTSSSYLTSDEEDESGPSIMERALGQTGQRKVQQYLSAKKRLEAEQAQWRQAKKQSTSYASLPHTQQADGGDGATPTAAHRAFGARGTALSRVEAPQLSSSSRKKKGAAAAEHRDSLQERKDEEASSHVLDTAVSIQDASPTAAVYLPYSANLYQPSHSRSPSALSPKRRPSIPSGRNGRVPSSRSFSLSLPSDSPSHPRVSLMYRLQAVLLFNLPLYMSRTAVACLLLLLLFVRLGVSLIIFSSTFQLVRWLFAFALILYPLAPLFVPLLGLLALVSSSTHACRFFSAAVVLSLLNDVVVLVGSVYSFNTSLGYIDALLLPPAAVLVTLALLMTAHAYVAHLEVLKDLVIGRREHSRERDVDEGYGGGLVVSQSPQSSRKSSRRGSLQQDTQQTERREKERKRAAKYAARALEAAEAKSEDSSLSQPPTPSTAASEEPNTPIQQREAFASHSSQLSTSPAPTTQTPPMAVPTHSSPPSVFIPTLSPVLPTPPSMGGTPHSVLTASFASLTPIDIGSPPPSPATPATPASVVSITPRASPASSRPPSNPHTPSSAHHASTAPTSTRTVRGGSSATSTPTGARRGRGGGRGGGGGVAGTTPTAAGTRGRGKRGVKRGV